MADTRIIDLPNQVTIGEGSFVAVDSDSDGTRKYDLAQIASVADANVIASMAERAAQIATEAAERRIDDAIDAMGDISEIAVPLMSADVRGGAKLGEGLALTDGALGIDPAPQQSTGEVRGSIAALTAKGWAEQDGTPTPSAPVEIQVVRGRNLLPSTATTQTISGVTFTVDEYGSIRAKGTSTQAGNLFIAQSGRTGLTLEAGTYTLSLSGQMGNGCYLRVYDGTTIYASITEGSKTFTLTSTKELSVYINFLANLALDFVIAPQIERGSVAHGYVPYGGYVGMEMQGRNLVFGMVNKYLSVGSGNVWTITAGANMRSALARVEPNKTYTFSRVGGNRTMIAIVDSDNPTTVVRQIANDPTLTTHTFATQSGERFVMMSVTNDVNASPVTGVQLELGSVAHDYEPYFHTTTPIPLPSRGWVASLPDGTADVLTLDGAGKVEWELPTEMQVFDGSSDEGWVRSSSVNVAYVNKFGGVSLDTLIGTPKSPGYHHMSTIAKDARAKTAASALVVGDSWLGSHNFNNSSSYMVFAVDSSIATVSDWTTLLAANPVTVLYPLATPTTEERGYVDMPAIPGTATVSIPELDDLGVTYLIGDSVREMAEQWYARARSEYEGRIAALEQAVAELVTS